jgi:protein-S-isoprenylcysteine O-methyltransferase Ste14
MPVVALALFLLYIVLTTRLPALMQRRRIGSTGVHGLVGRLGTVKWVAAVGFHIAVVLGVVAPLLALLGIVEPIAALDTTAVHVAGLVLTVLGIAATVLVQVRMGESWRAGVDPEESTRLVTTGPFAVVRNPIFTVMLPAALGFAMLVPNWVALLRLAVLAIALELQVRMVEEPYLRRTHGAEYAGYAARVGRFLPGVGRLSATENPSGSAFQSR